MGSMSIWHWLILLVIVLLLFGAGKVPKLMGDMAKGIKAFKEGMKDMTADDASKPSEPPPAAAQVPPPETKKDTAKV
jgi:sec-independent protein translocase protein TatA